MPATPATHVSTGRAGPRPQDLRFYKHSLQVEEMVIVTSFHERQGKENGSRKEDFGIAEISQMLFMKSSRGCPVRMQTTAL